MHPSISPRTIVIAALVLLVVLFVAAALLQKQKLPEKAPAVGIASSPTLPPSPIPSTNNGPPTRFSSPSEVVLPSPGTTKTVANVAVPEQVVPSRPGAVTAIRTFNIRAAEGQFVPNTVTAKQGDTIHLQITAVDRDYDFTQPDYGFKGVVITRGQTRDVAMDVAAAGKFKYYCAACGGSESSAVGYIIVAPK